MLSKRAIYVFENNIFVLIFTVNLEHFNDQKRGITSVLRNENFHSHFYFEIFSFYLLFNRQRFVKTRVSYAT